LTGFIGTTGLSAIRYRPVLLSRATGWPLWAVTATDFSCCLSFPLFTCHCHYPGGRDGSQIVFRSASVAFTLRVEVRRPRLAFSRPAGQFTTRCGPQTR